MQNAAPILLQARIDPAVEHKQPEATVKVQSLRSFQPTAFGAPRRRRPASSLCSEGAGENGQGQVSPLGKVPVGLMTVPMALEALWAVEERAAIESASRLRQHMSDRSG